MTVKLKATGIVRDPELGGFAISFNGTVVFYGVEKGKRIQILDDREIFTQIKGDSQLSEIFGVRRYHRSAILIKDLRDQSADGISRVVFSKRVFTDLSSAQNYGIRWARRSREYYRLALRDI